MNGNQVVAALGLVRSVARALRLGTFEARQALDEAATSVAVGLPDAYATISLAVCRKILSPSAFLWMTRDALSDRVLRRLVEVETVNARHLHSLSAVLGPGPADGSEPPIMLGYGAALLSLYRSLAAFPVTNWVVAAPPEDAARRAVPRGTLTLVGIPPASVRFVEVDRLAQPLRLFSTVLEVEGRRWRVPVGELLVLLLAARLGKNGPPAAPPVWPHLGVALLAGRERLDRAMVLSLAEEAGIAERVRRGLALVCFLFPELRAPWADLLFDTLPEKRWAEPLPDVRVLVRAALESAASWDDRPEQAPQEERESTWPPAAFRAGRRA